jgi:uncharacterized protein YgiM (DUF1202 family)
MSPRAFRPIFARSSRKMPLLSLAVLTVAAATTAWAAASLSPAPSNSVRPTLIVSMAPTSAPAVTPPAPATVTPPAAPAGAAPAAHPAAPPMSAATAPATLVPTPGSAGAAAATPVPAPTPAPEVGSITQPFVATITGDKVYLRSGPDTKYYEIGQLYKGDLVYVVGLNKGWYQVLPPNGSFCMIAKEFIDLDTGGAGGTIKGDFVNVRAGSAIYKDADPYAVLPPPLRKGARVKVLGSTDKFYQVAPPEKAYFFVNAQFVKAAAGTEYKVAQLKLPAGVTGPTGITVVAPTTLPAVAAVLPESPSTPPAVGGVTPAPSPTIAPAPSGPTYNEAALAKFKDASAKYQQEAKKAPADQNVDSLLQDFKDILAMDNISPSVKSGAQAYIAAAERTQTVQRLIKEQATSVQDTKSRSEALRAQQDAAERAVNEAKAAGPYAAQGLLKTSTVVAGMYALVNPEDQRVVAYVDPAIASINMDMLVGKYIGVRGESSKMNGSDITVIKVNNATMMPQPK